jgi:hypothetical protein
MKTDGSYRDETTSLAAENARLRSKLARTRGPRRRLGAAATLAALDIVMALALRPWFNGASDAKFWAACALVSLLALGATAFAVSAV